MKEIELVVVTGMSGAGKTVAMQCFEDLGYFCVDNMPAALLPKFWKLIKKSSDINKVALAIDLRSYKIDENIENFLVGRQNKNSDFEILFLDASDSELVARYKETRRSHPLEREGRIIDGVKKERELLAPLKLESQFMIDTSNITPRELRKRISDHFNGNKGGNFYVDVLSFGYKYGIPIDADIVMDVRFLPNPYYVDSLKDKKGFDKAVYDYVMDQPATESFYQHFLKLIKEVMPGYQKEGKHNVVLAIGCTGGKHRSVALTERLYKDLKDDYETKLKHRDVDKNKETVNRS